jgi:hypothetical protein
MMDQNGILMTQLHKQFTSEQVKVQLAPYDEGHMSREETKRVNVVFPAWVVETLDREPLRLGGTPQSINKCGWLNDYNKVDSSELVLNPKKGSRG